MLGQQRPWQVPPKKRGAIVEDPTGRDLREFGKRAREKQDAGKGGGLSRVKRRLKRMHAGLVKKQEVLEAGQQQLADGEEELAAAQKQLAADREKVDKLSALIVRNSQQLREKLKPLTGTQV